MCILKLRAYSSGVFRLRVFCCNGATSLIRQSASANNPACFYRQCGSSWGRTIRESAWLPQFLLVCWNAELEQQLLRMDALFQTVFLVGIDDALHGAENI